MGPYGYGLLYLLTAIGVILFVICSKGLILEKGLKVNFRQILKPLILANTLSLIVSIPVSSFNKDLFFLDLSTYLRSYLFIALWGTALYFFIAFFIEFFVIKRSLAKRYNHIKTSKIALFVFIGNLLVFIVLAPVYFIESKPHHDILEFADDSSWASEPLTAIYYIDTSSGNLCSILSNGYNKQVLVPDKVTNYQLIPSSDTFLYRNQDNDLYLFRGRDQKRFLCWKTNQRFWMNQVASSPDGKTVAYLMKIDRHGPFELVLFNPDTNLTYKTGIITDHEEFFPELVWTNKNSELILKHSNLLDRVIIDDDYTVRKKREDNVSSNIMNSYGRYAYSRGGNLNEWWPLFSAHSFKDLSAVIWDGNYIKIEHKEKSLFISDISGILFRSSKRHLRDIHVLQNGAEIIINDQKFCYLFDVNKQKIGKITNGKNFMVLSNRFKRSLRVN